MEKHMRGSARQFLAGASSIVVAAVAWPANADQIIFWTNFSSNQLMKTDVTTSTTTVLEATPGSGGPDSLIFDASGNIIYTKFGGDGEVRSFNPNTNADTLIKGGLGSQATDVTLEPGGTTVLVSERTTGHLDRITLANGNTSVLGTYNFPNGVTYDNAGHLFLNTDTTVLDQLNPANGSVLNSVNLANHGNFLDGITYDAGTNLIFSTSGTCMDTTNATTLAAGACLGTFSLLDGIESDGNGHIIAADVGSGSVKQYDIASNTTITLFSAPGLDDIAPLSGLGAPPPVPEPASLTILASGVFGLAWAYRRRREQF
jgi:hypothetical protein